MKATLFLVILVLCSGAPRYPLDAVVTNQDCSSCDHIIRGYLNDGIDMNIQPGDVVCFDSRETYERVKIQNIKGTKSDPVIIRNCGGQAFIPDGLRFAKSENFILSGDGAENERYGIKVSIHKSFFITFEDFTTDFEVFRVEVAGYAPNGIGDNAGFAGMGIKTSPYQDCDLFSDSTRQAWIMKNVSIHDNYIHDVGGEGLYIGHGFYKGRTEKGCSTKTWSHSIQGLRVFNNLVENTGYDGIQIKNADKDCEVYNNVIRNYGTKNHNAHNEGLIIADGVTGKVYNNLIDTGTGHGIMFQGMGNNDIFNNIVLNAGGDGFNGTKSPTMGIYLPDSYVRILNNTIYNSGNHGFVCYHDQGSVKIVANNLVVKSGGKLHPKGAPMVLSNNIFSQDSTLITRIDFVEKTLSMETCPSVIDQGLDIRVYDPTFSFDYFNADRPRGNGFDIGAIEFR